MGASFGASPMFSTRSTALHAATPMPAPRRRGQPGVVTDVACGRSFHSGRQAVSHGVAASCCGSDGRDVAGAHLACAGDDGADLAIRDRIEDRDGLAQAAFGHRLADRGERHAGRVERHRDRRALGDEDGVAHIVVAQRFARAQHAARLHAVQLVHRGHNAGRCRRPATSVI